MTRRCLWPAAVITATVIASLWFAAASQAQINCGTRDSVVEELDLKYSETQRGYGLTGSTAIFEVWASEKTGSWTILKTTPNGLTCVIAVGENWHGAPASTLTGSPV